MTLYKLPPTYVAYRQNRSRNPRLGVDATDWSVTGTWGSSGRAAVPGPDGETVNAMTASGNTGIDVARVRHTRTGLPAATFRIGFWAYVTWASGTAPLAVLTVDGVVVETLEAVSGWHWYGFPPRVVATGSIFADIRVSTTTVNATVHVTRMLVGGGTWPDGPATAADYFDGSFDSTTAVQYTWDGTPDNSISLMSVPSASDTLEPVMTLAPYTARREAGTIVHRLLEDSQARFTWRQPNLPVGLFEFLFDGHATAYAALSKLSARTAWALVDDADDGPIERWFMIADGDLEMEQSREVENAYVVRVPYVEVDSI